MKTALAIIDMQEGSFTPRTTRHDTSGLVERLNTLAGAVRSAGGWSSSCSTMAPVGDPHHPDQPGWQLLPELEVRDGDLIVRKTSCNSFLGTTLGDTTLKSHAIERLIVTGCATDYCVDTTVRSALGRGYATIAPADGHRPPTGRTSPRSNSSRTTNSVWADFIAPGGPATVCACADVPVS